MGCQICDSEDDLKYDFCSLCREREAIIPVYADLRNSFKATKKRITQVIIFFYILNVYFFFDGTLPVSLYSSIVGTVCSIAYLLRVVWCYNGTIKNLIILRDQLRNDPNLRN